MNRILALLGTIGAVSLGAGVAWVGGSSNALLLAGIPIFTICIGLAFVIQWLCFIPSFILRSEKYYDLIGSTTFISVAVLGAVLADTLDLRSAVILACICIWAARLGLFLFSRVAMHGDKRFRTIKQRFMLFLMTYTLQGLWVSMSVGAGLVVLTSTKRIEPDIFLAVGFLLWLLGFLLEVVADEQKRRFHQTSENKDRFITHGLWAWSQHPNYFGEILLWLGISLIALPVLDNWQYFTLLSAPFVWLLLTKISGIRMLDNLAHRKWGDDADYQQYCRDTPKLWPKPPRSFFMRSK